jgi:hypothetical protein
MHTEGLIMPDLSIKNVTNVFKITHHTYQLNCKMVIQTGGKVLQP